MLHAKIADSSRQFDLSQDQFSDGGPPIPAAVGRPPPPDPRSGN
ncbi:MAG TPA: hypothetical protein VFI31_03765 [Pirellulales bacterium]|nr:hypothetical protein [Pirellulales bacterium]